MAEVIIRHHKRRTDRWMPRERRLITWAHIRGGVKLILRCVPGCLLSFADVLGIPSGFYAAYGMALAMTGKDARPTLIGCVAAIFLQLLSGLQPRWEMLIALPLIAVAPMLLHGRKTAALILLTGAAMLPVGIAASLSATAAETLQGWAAMAIAALSAPVMVRAINCLTSGRPMAAMEEQVAVGYLASACVCGGARLMLLGFNIGVLLSACLVICVALILGAGAGAVAGMLAGVMLALQGLPLTLSVALSLGGFLCGMTNSMSRRRISCGAFALGTYLPLLLCYATAMGSGVSVLAAALIVGMAPRSAFEQAQQFLRRFLPNDAAPGDAYAAATLNAWEHTISAMARAVPSPRDSQEGRSAQWWQEKLCLGCPEYERCGCLSTELGVSKAEAVWEYRHAEEQVWKGALEHLRGMGCQRLYHLLEAMNALRREDETARRVIRQSEIQRDMLVTHLTAMSGAARRFAALSSGENWWDAITAKQIRKVLAERAIPASLSYVRRVQGHVQAAFDLHFITGARNQAETLCALTSAVLDTPVHLACLDGERVLLQETPFLRLETGMAAEPISNGKRCGDTSCSVILQDGRGMVALSDGMGHGEQAALSSRQTVELLRLCLDAGYTRQQTLTAVNGMLLLGGGGERFATADILTVDLWKGEAVLDKLGAAASWLYQQGVLTRLCGDALPLGIIEEIDMTGCSFTLQPGDAVVLLTDGIEDAFQTTDALEHAIQSALCCESPQMAAARLLEEAFAADDGQRRDDQSVVFVYVQGCKWHV